MQVLEVRNGELIGSIIRQAAEQGITHVAIVALRAYVIPTEHPIALAAGEQVVVEEFPDDGLAGRGRVNHTRVTSPFGHPSWLRRTGPLVLRASQHGPARGGLLTKVNPVKVGLIRCPQQSGSVGLRFQSAPGPAAPANTLPLPVIPAGYDTSPTWREEMPLAGEGWAAM
jgi:hypothetical protein